MPVRIPKARATEGVAFATAGVVGFAPLYFLIPGAEERLASQTLKWAPRWERNISYFVRPAERVAQRVERPVSKNVKKLDDKLPLERMALGVDRRIKYGVDRFGKQ
ncbi:4-coumarate:coenzyme a ligase [Seiridium cupressi]|uniref:4-coumarate:coenzyme A ligase n=2 Tax=Seiridium TaxID=138063 RepID=A0ABR2V3R8_9PEZI